MSNFVVSVQMRLWPALKVVSWMAPLALLHGLIFLLIMPPWQHYDEPSHLSYAAQIAAEGRELPLLHGPLINLVIADSMYRYNFYPPGEAPVIDPGSPPSVGYGQWIYLPLYYGMVAILLEGVQQLPIEQQLYAARGLSLCFYVLTILVAWRVAVVMLPEQPQLQLIIPLLLLFMPTFVDIMTAVNNDVLVNFGVMVMFLGCALMIRDGLRPTGLILALLGLAVGVLAKRTAVMALPILALALFWSVRRRPLPLAVLLPVMLLGIVGLPAAALHVAYVEGRWQLLPREWLMTLDQNYLSIFIDLVLRSVTDWELSAPFYPLVLQTIFESFWARLAWGHVPLGMPILITILLLVVASLVGLLIRGWQDRYRIPLWQRRFIWLLFISVCIAWIAAILRIHPLPPLVSWFYVPRGRYMFWALLPHLWLLVWGWQGLFPARWRPQSALLLLGGAVVLSTYTWAVAVPRFYYGG